MILKLVLLSLAVCSSVMVLVWLWAYKIKNAGVVDIFWAYCFVGVGALLYLLGDGFNQRKMLVCGMLALWGLRLGTYLLFRVGSHLKEEEGRYAQLRKEWQPNPN